VDDGERRGSCRGAHRDDGTAVASVARAPPRARVRAGAAARAGAGGGTPTPFLGQETRV
jgi:hypothetical protein